eukprot:CAMPEP_0185740620 /NCGR_PEP_ID=MMETSP1171-20130828/38199_1 /TAXON_ID=374046 /ORGANISM="Helicotheca tamensis, Strain CCMP826" /LENGTH=238 /DNA_ID=CAMNT_0028412511 /DNA_START=194 /DNA_END=910 /DNA_ORIENTATION=+
MSSSTSDDGTEVLKRKKAMRKEIRSRLKSLSQEKISEQSNAVWSRLFDLKEYREASSVGLFLSMPTGEIETDTALTHVLENGKDLYVPRVGLDFERCDMDLIKVKFDHDTEVEIEHSKEKARRLFYHDWPRNKWGIPEPPTDVDHALAGPGDIDLLVVPGLAFDKLGGRLGQGKGYYDRFISKICPDGEKRKTLLVAVALEPQFLKGNSKDETVPMAKYDFGMDMVVLPDRTITVSKD